MVATALRFCPGKDVKGAGDPGGSGWGTKSVRDRLHLNNDDTEASK